MSEATQMSGLLLRVQQRQEEHERRMREDPVYRAEQEEIQARRRAEEAAEERRGEAERRQALTRARGAKGIPEFTWTHLDRYRAGHLDAPGAAGEALGWVRRFLIGEPGWFFLLLAGTPGLGKTVAASRFADAPWTGSEPGWNGEMRTVTREVGARFVTAEELARQSTFDGEFWEGVRETPRLVIDDLGVERLDDKGWAMGNLVGLFSHRHAHALPTVITMNISRQAFESRYCAHDGGRLRDRLAESGWFVALEGPSLRRRLSLEGDGT
jgi:DNA replication protein DnaC